ncbi:citrate (Si)-synthase [Ranunculus cassubicifolius]
MASLLGEACFAKTCWCTSLLVLATVPTEEQVYALSKDLRSRAKVPDYVYKTINALAKTAHPMTQFATGVMALQVQSKFQNAYENGMSKSEIYKDGKIVSMDDSLDYGANFSHMLGFDDPIMQDLIRLYLTIHADHEGGNVSAHTGRLVASALSDPYLSFAAALNGLAGPLHGLANQEALLWIKCAIDKYGVDIPKEQLESYVNDTLKAGKVVPGFGHGVLRVTDPRYTCLQEFASKHSLTNDPLFKVVKNPYPNVDAHSGVLLNHFGMTEERYFTVLFGVSRSIGICSQLIWDRALGLPIERPKSVTMEWLENQCEKPSTTS